MRSKILLLYFILFSTFSSAQTHVIIGSAASTSSSSGLSSSTTAGDRNERHACIYSAAELTAAGLTAGTNIMSIAWDKTGGGFYYDKNLTIRIWLKHSAATTFAASPVFATETTGATLVYQSTSDSIRVATGWLNFSFNTATPFFTWDGAQNLEVITELIRPTDWTVTGFLWRTITTVTNGAANANGTIAAPPATLTRTGTRPQIRVGIPTTGIDAALVGMPNPVSGPAGSQNIVVQLRNTGTTTLTSAMIAWSIDGAPSTNTPWTGPLVPGAITSVTLGSNNFAGGPHNILAVVNSPNGGTDADPTNNSFSKNIITCSPLSGAYTINQGLPTSGTNFNSFTDFSTYLTNCGISGNVVATVTPGSGPYTEQVIFQNITGIGPSAAVSIQGSGETITSDTAIIQTGSNPGRHIIRLINLQYFTINNLHVDMFTGSTGFIGIHVLNNGNHIVISNCVINMGTATSTLLGAIACTGSPSSLLVEGNFNDIQITGNSSTGGGYGAVLYGLLNTTTINNVISNNTFNGSNTNGIYVQNTGGLIITGNHVNFAASNGIQVAGAGNINTLVEKNFISCTNPTISNTLRGIYMFGNNPSFPNKVVNNLISNMNAPAANIIGITNRTPGAEFYFNTIILDQAAATGTVTWGFDEDLNNLNSLLRNNIFYISRGTSNYTAAIALFSNSVTATTINSNNNVFYTSNGAYVGVRKGTVMANPPTNIYNTLADWQSASGEDANSFATDPLFQAGTGIPQSAVINGQGTTIAGITTDIVNVVRSSPPDPGAYEFNPPSGDAAMTDFILPTLPYCAATLPVQFELTNSGGNTLNSVTINWTVNGVPQPVVNWSGPPLASGAATIVTLGTIPVNGSTLYNFSATTSLPNGSPDVNPSNDNFTYNGFRLGFSGAYTIDASSPASATNFQAFQNIADVLNLYGVCGAVVITVMNGPYLGQPIFRVIPGTSAVNTVTLNGNGRTLQFNPTIANTDHILQLNGVNHMIVENLTVISLHATQGRGIHITNGASKLAIRNNNVSVSLTNSMSTAFGIIISGANWLLDGSLSDSVVISGNTVTGGYSGIQLSGIHWTQPLTRIRVSGNTVLDWYGFGVYLSYTNNCVVSKNIIRRPVRVNSGSDAVTPAGITVPAGSLGFLLEKNRIFDLHVSMPGTPTISRGIHMSGTTTAPTSGTIQNNLIYGMNNDGAQYGIQNNSVTGPVNIFHNTIVLNNATGATTSNTNAINMSNFNAQAGTDMRNNLFYVTRGGTGVKRIIDVTDVSTTFVSNYNAVYLNAPGGVSTYGQIGSTNYQTLADWQATGKDLNSIHTDPLFANPPAGNYAPTSVLIDGTAMGTTQVGGIIDDILDVVRSAAPDAGAYEFIPPPCSGAVGGTASTSSGPFCGSGSGTITATGYSIGTGSGYQWQYSNDNFVTNINDLVGQTNPASASTGTITSTTYYRLRVTCPSGTTVAFSNIVTIVINQGVVITTHPASQAICAGSNVTFTVVATGSGLTYQWRKAASAISGATSASYTINGVVAGDAGSYDVIVTGICNNVTSNPAVLTVNPLTAITVQPQSQAICSGSGVTFSVTATGAGLLYQWRRNSTNITGATSSTYTIATVTAGDVGNYDVVVTGTCGTATSSVAVLSLNATGTWIGVISTNWNVAGNWCGGIPTPTSDIIIPATAPNQPLLSAGNGTARHITINIGASITVGAGGNLDIYGNLTNNGTFNAAAGNLGFRGGSPQTIPSFTTINAVMNGTGGVILLGNAAVTGTLTLTSGNITLGTSNLELLNSSTGSVGSHVVTNGTGRLIMRNLAAGNTRTAPVGPNATSYNPAILTANAGHITDDFPINVQQGVFTAGLIGPFITTHVVDRQWFIAEGISGGSNINLALQWNGSEELSNFERNRNYIMQYTGGAWQATTETPASGSNPYVQVKNNITSFSTFAVKTTSIPRPRTGIYPNPAKNSINVVLDLPAGGPVIFNVYDAAGRLIIKQQVNLATGLSQTTLDLRKLSIGTHTLRVSAGGNPEFLVAKFVKAN